LGDYHPGIPLVIGGNGIPGRVMGAGGIQAILVSRHVMLPIFPLVNIRAAEFPVLVRLIDTVEKSLPLFILRQMEEDLHNLRAVPVEMLLQVHD